MVKLKQLTAIVLHIKSVNYDSKKHNNHDRIYLPAHQAESIFNVSN